MSGRGRPAKHAVQVTSPPFFFAFLPAASASNLLAFAPSLRIRWPCFFSCFSLMRACCSFFDTPARDHAEHAITPATPQLAERGRGARALDRDPRLAERLGLRASLVAPHAVLLHSIA